MDARMCFAVSTERCVVSATVPKTFVVSMEKPDQNGVVLVEGIDARQIEAITQRIGFLAGGHPARSRNKDERQTRMKPRSFQTHHDICFASAAHVVSQSS
jgi:hypothetical protein